MLIGVISDTHLSLPDGRLERLLNSTLGKAEVILHAGDHTANGVAEYLEFVEPRPCHGVAGNCDSGLLALNLGTRKILDFGGVSLGLIHGWGPETGLIERVAGEFPDSVRVIVYGHSHNPSVKRVGGRLFVNPGSAFSPRAAAHGTAALLKIENGQVEAEILEVEEWR